MCDVSVRQNIADLVFVWDVSHLKGVIRIVTIVVVAKVWLPKRPGTWVRGQVRNIPHPPLAVECSSASQPPAPIMNPPQLMIENGALHGWVVVVRDC